MLVASPFPGGAEKSAVELALALRNRAVRVEVLMPPQNPLLRRLAAGGIPVHSVPLAPPVRPALSWDFARFAAGVRGMSRLRRLLARFEVLIANGTAAMVYAVLSAYRGRLVYVVRDVRMSGPVGQVLCSSADVVVAISRFVENAVRDSGVPSGKLRLVRNGLDVDFYRQAPGREESRRRLGLPEEGHVVLWLGNICLWKRPALFIRAARRLADKAAFLMAGGAHFSGDQAFAAGIAERAEERGIRFFPFNEDPRWFYGAASLVVTTSRNEPFGRTAVEAMAAGAPVLAPRSGAFPEIVAPEQNGVLVDDTGDLAADAEALIRAVEAVLSAPARLDSFSEGARRTAAEFDVSQTAEAFAALL